MLKVKLVPHLNITPWQHTGGTDLQLCAFYILVPGAVLYFSQLSILKDLMVLSGY